MTDPAPSATSPAQNHGAGKKSGAKKRPVAPPRRRVSLRLEIEADSLEIARQAAARAVSRFAVGQDRWAEETIVSSGELVLQLDAKAPTGEAYSLAMDAWRLERADPSIDGSGDGSGE